MLLPSFLSTWHFKNYFFSINPKSIGKNHTKDITSSKLKSKKRRKTLMSSNLLKEVRNKKIYFLYGYPGNDSYEKAALNVKKP